MPSNIHHAVAGGRAWHRPLAAVALALPLALMPGTAMSQPAAPAAAKATYIVQFHDGVDARAEAAAGAGRGLAVTRVLTHVYPGMIATMNEAQAAALARNPRVVLVEKDQVVTASTTQAGATWGLDRIDQLNRPLSGSYSYETTGDGVTAYVIDTGVLASHVDVEGRVAGGYDVVDNDANPTDCNGHGTHVAGTVGGSTHGVAKDVTIVPVRVLNCSGSGTTSGVVAGLDWVVSDHEPLERAVANMSLGGPVSTAMDAAVGRVISDGVTVVVAAGNSNRDACNYSPARVKAAITVAATTSTDVRASYSNYGSCVDLFAPGSSITSAWIGSDSETATITGTSMASPHVAGVVARLLQGSALTPASASTAITGAATKGLVVNAGRRSPNLLLYVAPTS